VLAVVVVLRQIGLVGLVGLVVVALETEPMLELQILVLAEEVQPLVEAAMSVVLVVPVS